MTYSLVYSQKVIDDDIPKLSKSAPILIKKAIEERLSLDPIHFGKPLRYSLFGHRCLRVSDYRVVYRVETDQRRVVIIAIKHRKEVYE